MLGRCEEFRDQLCASQAKKAQFWIYVDLGIDFVQNGIDFLGKWEKVALEICFPCDSYVTYGMYVIAFILWMSWMIGWTKDFG